MDVIGAGFGRTGTLSLKTALEQLGLGPCAHMQPLIEEQDRIPFWLAAAEGDPEALDDALAGFSSTVDWPGAYFWRALVARHPAAKVVLTVRDPGEWYDSTHRTIYQAFQAAPPGPFRELVDATVWRGTFDGRFDDRAAMIALFEEHNATVRREIAPERLLVFRVAEGWGPLCSFLGRPVPDGPFPRLNDSASFLEFRRLHAR